MPCSIHTFLTQFIIISNLFFGFDRRPGGMAIISLSTELKKFISPTIPSSVTRRIYGSMLLELRVLSLSSEVVLPFTRKPKDKRYSPRGSPSQPHPSIPIDFDKSI